MVEKSIQVCAGDPFMNIWGHLHAPDTVSLRVDREKHGMSINQVFGFVDATSK